MTDCKALSQSIILGSLSIGFPPVLSDPTEGAEQFLTNPEFLDIHNYERSQRFLPREPIYEACYSIDVTAVQTGIVVERDVSTGKSCHIKEEYLLDAGKSAKNSTSLRRLPGSLQDGIRGSTTNYPFWPGGLEEPNIEELKEKSVSSEIDFSKDFATVPPGFSAGVTFERKNLMDFIGFDTKVPSVVYLSDLLGQGQDIDLAEDETELNENVKTPLKDIVINKEALVEFSGPKYTIEDVIQLQHGVSSLVMTSAAAEEESWVSVVDVGTPVQGFHKKIPSMALEFPFELDTFQKQAIIHLENHDNVFVAAHTSAGKTVVAEYAIAMSQQHMTRSIYTSPIKALSNQKFRDFKERFEDVGLVTGDVQIKPEASCLIMTTEILRSMLYNGSDVVRDLEWVIFDEVHYVNDAERGVVWEEVLIMLPKHANIIMLSATVPNTREFAEWVGRTKKKKVYVISTPKRPVPLEHYLFTGNSTKTNNELFLLLDANKKFLEDGYKKAIKAKSERASKSSQGFGSKGPRYSVNPKQNKNIWLSVIDMLTKTKKMPAVAFIFSRRLIGDTADQLESVDLTDQKEKSQIYQFFERSISRLKGSDRKLPQVVTLRDQLKRGIGIHHSGILPILKEVVEMLFQKGLVKILFATETFAMGVNMPARTVLFDSIRKHDGRQLRDLLPGEYIQMAGRAGRRGLDTTGTVILLCKEDVPELSDLHRMMLGTPTHLNSQFRITYTMVLNLLRMEQLRVEDMIKRSFGEFNNQKELPRWEEKLKELLKCRESLPNVIDCSGDLEHYHDVCDEYLLLKETIQTQAFLQPHGLKMLSAGRVVVVNTVSHRNSLGVILGSVLPSKRDRTFKVLVICEQKRELPFGCSDDSARKDTSPVTNSDWLGLELHFLGNKYFRPTGPCGQEIIEVGLKQITYVSSKLLKINAEKIIEDVRKREMPRFRKDEPSQNTTLATQELLRLTEVDPGGLPMIDPVKDLHVKDLDIIEKFSRMKFLEDSLPKYNCIHDPSFEENLKQLHERKALESEIAKLTFQLSEQNLALLPEYKQRIEVLRELKYIDNCNVVQLKGRVACEISSQELIITELVLENVLSELHPTEIAALLSCVVFEQKRCSEPNLNGDLIACKEQFLAIAERINSVQKSHRVPVQKEDVADEFNFGLMEVVFEWARGLPFSKITELTDVQEGIIVRCIQRLDEVIRDVYKAARIIGDPVLSKKMEEASAMIKRDIVFAASLYTH